MTTTHEPVGDRPPFPLPVPTEDNQPFWDALRERKQLVVQECSACSTLVHPPRPMCPECGAFEKTWRPMSGRGAVYSYVVTHQAIHPAYNGFTPFATVLVQLEEGPLVTTHLFETPHEEIEIGMPVELVTAELSEKITLPLFRRA